MGRGHAAQDASVYVERTAPGQPRRRRVTAGTPRSFRANATVERQPDRVDSERVIFIVFDSAQLNEPE